jgi:hypothetical protein
LNTFTLPCSLKGETFLGKFSANGKVFFETDLANGSLKEQGVSRELLRPGRSPQAAM